jgi:hypothetical protein
MSNKKPTKKQMEQNRRETEINMSDMITQVEAAEMRGVSRAAITDLVNRGRLRSVELFGKRLVFRSEVEAFEREYKGWPKGKARKSSPATLKAPTRAARASHEGSTKKAKGKK